MTVQHRFAVLGNPIAHSKSPSMHAAGYRARGLSHSHSYEAIRAESQDLSHLIERLRAGEFEGFNVTSPHKKSVLDLVDDIAPSARAVGAANTLVRHDANEEVRIIAHNTDVPALAGELVALAADRALWRMPGRQGSAIVLGSGGAARAAVVALTVNLGIKHVEVRGRSFADEEKADTFANEMKSIVRDSTESRIEIDARPWEPSVERESDADIVVQASSAGMVGADPGQTAADAIAWGALPQDSIAFDVVYSPQMTPFLEAAQSSGHRFANGLGMLARQGAIAFELWLGSPAPFDAMLQSLMK